MRRHGRVDGCQSAIVEALRRVGLAVEITSDLGGGFPDLVVGSPVSNRVFLLECKQPGEQLTPAERRWHLRWGRLAAIVHSVSEALAAVGVEVG